MREVRLSLLKGRPSAVDHLQLTWLNVDGAHSLILWEGCV